MKFNMALTLPAPPSAIWPLFFDVARVAQLIPGCEQVTEITPLAAYSAVMKQKVGPFRLEVPAEITVEALETERLVRSRTRGRDRYTGTTLEVELAVTLEPAEGGTHLAVESTMQVNGRLATLGYAVVKRKSEEIFAEFARRLRAQLEPA